MRKPERPKKRRRHERGRTRQRAATIEQTTPTIEPMRRRVVLSPQGRFWMGAVGLAPLLLVGIGTPLLLFATDLGEIVTSDLPMLVLAASIQVTTAAAVLVHYWLPRCIDLVRPDGRAFRRLEGDLLVLGMPGGLPAIGMLAMALGYGVVSPWPVVLAYTGSLVVVLPTAAHRAVERRRATTPKGVIR